MADLVVVEGPDAESFLQGQLSQDVAALAVGAQAWSFVLEPNGHVVALGRLGRDGDERFTLTVDDGAGAAVEARLRKFLLRTKATIAVTPGGAPDDDERARIQAGRPGTPEIDERTVPAETGWVAHAVSFTKGCYTGQELVARMDSRVADPPRRLVRLSGAEGTVVAGAPVVVDDVEAGSVTSVVASDAGFVALAYLKRGTRLEGDAVAGGVPAVIEGAVGA